MTMINLFFVAFFWAFVFCQICVSVAATLNRDEWLELLVNGVLGSIWCALLVAISVVVGYAIWLAHIGLFGGGA